MVFYRKRKQADVGVFGVKVRLAISRAKWLLHASTYRSIDSKIGMGPERALSRATTDWVISATEALLPMSCPWHRAGHVASQRCRAYERFWLGALWFAHTPLFWGCPQIVWPTVSAGMYRYLSLTYRRIAPGRYRPISISHNGALLGKIGSSGDHVTRSGRGTFGSAAPYFSDQMTPASLNAFILASGNLRMSR